MTTEDNQWVEDAINLMPKGVSHDQLIAFLLTITTEYIHNKAEAFTILMSMPLSYARSADIPLEVLKRMYISASEGVQIIIDKEAKAQKH